MIRREITRRPTGVRMAQAAVMSRPKQPVKAAVRDRAREVADPGPQATASANHCCQFMTNFRNSREGRITRLKNNGRCGLSKFDFSRLLKTGQALVKIVDDPKLYRINVQKHSPGYLDADIEQLVKRYPATLESVDRFIEQNYTQDFFVTPAAIELETRERLERLLTNVIYVPLLPMSGNAPDQVGNVENPLA